MDECNLPWAQEWISGITGATGKWCASQAKKVSIINGIKVWNSDSKKPQYTNGMKISYTSGYWTLIGRTDLGTERDIDWDVSKAMIQRIDSLPNSLAWDEHHYGMRIMTAGQKTFAGEFATIGTLYGGSECKGCRPQDINWDKHGTTPINGQIVGIAGVTRTFGIESITFYYIGADMKTKSRVIDDLEFIPSLEESTRSLQTSESSRRRLSIMVC